MISRFLVLALAMTALSSPAAGTQDPQFTEYELKAGLLFQIARHVLWPKEAYAAAPAQFKIGILGKDPFGKDLEAILKDKKVIEDRDDKKTVRTIELVRGETPADLAGCQIVFLASSEKDRLGEVLEAFRGKPALLVGDTPGFGKKGLPFNLFIENSKPRYEINKEAIERAGMKPDAQIVRSGIPVKTEGP